MKTLHRLKHMKEKIPRIRDELEVLEENFRNSSFNLVWKWSSMKLVIVMNWRKLDVEKKMF